MSQKDSSKIIKLSKYYVTFCRENDPLMFIEEIILAPDEEMAAKQAIKRYGPLDYVAVLRYKDFLYQEGDMSQEFMYPDYWDDE